MNATDQAIGYTANFTVTAFVILVSCLKNQGALGERQFEDALRATIDAAGDDRSRLDYQQLEILWGMLNKQTPGQPPSSDPLN